MIDRKKRILLKATGALAAGAVMPSVVNASVATLNSSATASSWDGGVFVDGELQIELSFGTEPSMRVTNTGSELTIVTQLQPGVVEFGGKYYDLNQALSSSAYAIGSGRSRYIPISPAADKVVRSAIHAVDHAPSKLVAVTANKAKDRLVHAAVAYS